MKPAVDDVHGAIAQLQRLADLFQQRRLQLAQSAGLSEQQWRVLEEIATEHFMPSMFARDRESTAAAVSRIIRQLLDKKLISVSVSPNDGRQRHYVLTARGTKTLDALRTSRRDAIESVWMDLDAAALRNFTRFSAALVARLEAYATRQPD
ncbi:MAG TPA: MarR family transcriptional regulator [Candidatus Binatia bacterium]|jgi:DNA-binding MarR family transcriptional regulator|nr:MarR family transcriptional regulator [Candidatus Binatia bacterium]